VVTIVKQVFHGFCFSTSFAVRTVSIILLLVQMVLLGISNVVSFVSFVSDGMSVSSRIL